MNLGNLLIVIFILLLFICFSVKSAVLKPITLVTTLILLTLFLVYLKKERFSDYIIISAQDMNEINMENQQYFIQLNLLKKLNTKLDSLLTILNRISG
jgi:hypothetical protein